MNWTPEPESPVSRLAREQITLELQQVGATVAASAELVEMPEYAWNLSRELVYQLRAYVLADHLVGDTYRIWTSVSVDIPTSWWQMLKRDHAPEWFKNKYPVKTSPVTRREEVDVVFDRYAAYPEANIAIPREQFGRPYIWEQVRVDR